MYRVEGAEEGDGGGGEDTVQHEGQVEWSYSARRERESEREF